MKKHFFALAVLCLTTLSAAAADGQTTYALAMHGQPKYSENFDHLDYANPDAPKGGTLRRAEVGTFDNLNPFLITGRVPSGLQEALLSTYDTLMVRAWNEPFTMYGMVAKSVVVSPERNSIEFHLDPKARFNDGHPITSEDVAYSHQALMQFGRPNQRRIYKLVKRLSIVDPHTIRFELGPGYDRETVMILANMPVLPKHYWATNTFGKTTLTPPLGSGPYKIKSVEPGRSVEFERVKDYWAKDKPFNRGLYNFDVLRYDFYRDDNAALLAFGAGQFDLRREWSAVTWVRDYNFDAVTKGDIIKENFANGRPTRAKFFVYNMRRAPFDDILVRRALAYAFDFEWLNKNIFLDTQSRIDSLFMNSELAYQGPDKIVLPKTDASGMAGLRPNLRQALDLFEQAGYVPNDGVLTNKKTGKPLSFEMLLNDPNDEKVALEFARALERIGVKAQIRTVDTAQYTGRMSTFDFDMTINFWRNSLSPGTEQAIYWGSTAADQQGSFNYSGLKSPAVDAQIALLTKADTREGLVSAARALDKLVMDSWIGIPLYDNIRDRIAYRRGIKHPDFTPLYGPVLETWWYDGQKSGKEVSKDSPPK